MPDLQQHRRRLGWRLGFGILVLLGLYIYVQHSGPKSQGTTTEETSNTLSVVPVISAYQSWNDVGEYATVLYPIGYSTTDGQGDALFEQQQNYPRGFEAVVLKADIPKWRRDPISVYKTGATIDVTGFIQSSEGHPQIIVTSPKQMGFPPLVPTK